MSSCSIRRPGTRPTSKASSATSGCRPSAFAVIKSFTGGCDVEFEHNGEDGSAHVIAKLTFSGAEVTGLGTTVTYRIIESDVDIWNCTTANVAITGHLLQPKSDACVSIIQPMKEGKSVLLHGLRAPKLLEITAPPDMRLKMEDLSDETLPRAVLKGKDGVVVVAYRDYDLGGIEDHLDNKFLVHSQRLERGFLLIKRIKAHVAGVDYKHLVIVWRPDLDVTCESDTPSEAATRETADKIASSCLSLREAPPKE